VPDDRDDRLTHLGQLADQQRRLNEQLLLLNARLSDQQGRQGETLADHRDRLSILERAQLLHSAAQHLHDATLRQHGMLLTQHAEGMAELRRLQERQERLMETLTGIASQHEERMAELHQLLQAIKDMLDRGDGH
jgi:chaperonin cofactor prefoldin